MTDTTRRGWLGTLIAGLTGSSAVASEWTPADQHRLDEAEYARGSHDREVIARLAELLGEVEHLRLEVRAIEYRQPTAEDIATAVLTVEVPGVATWTGATNLVGDPLSLSDMKAVIR